MEGYDTSGGEIARFPKTRHKRVKRDRVIELALSKDCLNTSKMTKQKVF